MDGSASASGWSAGRSSAINAAQIARKRDRCLDRTQQWALELADRIGHNKAAVALASKTLRRLWAAERHGAQFDPNHRSPRPPVQAA